MVVQLTGDGVEPVLHGRITDSEDLLHLLDGAVMSKEGMDEGLVVFGEVGEGGHLEVSLHGDAAACALELGDPHGGTTARAASSREIHCPQVWIVDSILSIFILIKSIYCEI